MGCSISGRCAIPGIDMVINLSIQSAYSYVRYRWIMIFLRSAALPEDRPDDWPYTIPALKVLDRLEFDAPVTLLAGDNGTGKSTLLEALAVKLALPAIGRVDAARDETLMGLRPLARGMSLVFNKRPNSKFFLRSEDFFNFSIELQKQREEMRRELQRVEEEYANRSIFAQNQARSSFAGSIGDMEGRYGRDLLESASHGESFLRLFQERLVPNGLYLLDEPEAPLSPMRQLALHCMIKDLCNEQNCQFIIATHSPILLSIEGAAVYDLDRNPPEKVSWEELPGVQLMKGFLNSPQSYTHRL
jgi:predicted ATPase